VRRGLILWRLVGLVLLVGAVSASAYAVGHATRKDDRDLGKVLAASSRKSQAAGIRVSRASRAPSAGSAEHRRSTKASKAKRKSASQKVIRGSIVVAVLNATNTSGVARGAADKLTAAGFGTGLVSNDPKLRATTSIFYAPGNRDAAVEVAKIVDVKQDAVRPVDPRTRSLIGADAKVVVTVGSDRARSSP
jgi:LytR cell envelope-related transcriptional attenuator